MARGYETLIIAHSEVLDEEIHGLVDKIKEIIARSGGDYLKTEKWGKRKLVYKIKGSLKGYFIMIYFTGEPRILQELNTLLRYNERVLRYQTIKLDKTFDFESLRQEEPQKPGERFEVEKGEQKGTEETISHEGAKELSP